MAIPDDVKRQAMDAVSHSETTAFIRLYRHNDVPVSTFSGPIETAPVRSGPIPDEVKKQAMDAVAHRETTAQIKLVEDHGTVFTPATPARGSAHASQKISELHRAGVGVDSVQRQMTMDHFGGYHG